MKPRGVEIALWIDRSLDGSKGASGTMHQGRFFEVDVEQLKSEIWTVYSSQE